MAIITGVGALGATLARPMGVSTVEAAWAVEADLRVVQIDSDDPVATGTSFSYMITVYNDGPDVANSVVLTDTLPTGVTVLDGGGCGETTPNVLICTWATIDAGSSRDVIIQLTAPGSAATLQNQVEVNSATPDLAAGNNLATESTLVQQAGSLVVVNQTDPAGGSGVSFLPGFGTGTAFTLNDGGSKVYNNLLPGQYTVSEQNPAPIYTLSAITCNDGGSTAPSSGNLGTRTATFNVEPDETVTCMFKNTRLGSIQIIKQTIPAGNSQSFNFGGSLGNFSLLGGQNKSVPQLVPNQTYTITEALPLGWSISGISCQGGTGTPVSSGPVVQGVAVPLEPGQNVVCTIVNQQACIEITETDAHSDVTEGAAINQPGGYDLYTVRLSSKPTADVKVRVVSNEQVASNKADLFFTSANWNQPQEVWLLAQDDRVDEDGLHTSLIIHLATSADPNYEKDAYDAAGTAQCYTNNGPTGADGKPDRIRVHITDNDTAGVAIHESGSSTNVAEGGEQTDGYTVRLNSQPIANVLVHMTTGVQVTATPQQLTFTPTDWNVARQVLVTAVDDALVEETQTNLIQHSVTSTDPNYAAVDLPFIGNGPTAGTNPRAVQVSVTDNDNAGFAISTSELSLTEGASAQVASPLSNSASYSIRLTSQPTVPVTVNLAVDGQITLNKSSLLLTEQSWNTPQNVIVAVVDDNMAEGPHKSAIRHTVSSADLAYASIQIDDVFVNIADNDSPSVSVTPATLTVAEGGPAVNFSIALTTRPTAPVTITVSHDAQVNVNGTHLRFTSSNWNQLQTIALVAVDDTVAEGGHTGVVRYRLSSSDPDYAGLAVADTTVQIVDNDTVGLSFAPATAAAAEAGPPTLYVAKLTSRPSAPVTVTLQTDGQVQVSTNGGRRLLFTSTNWETAQPVTVTAVDDVTAEGMHVSTVSHSFTSQDAIYGSLPAAQLAIEIADNDLAEVRINPKMLSVKESGGQASYTIGLGSQPAGDVVMTIAHDNQTIVTPAAFAFTKANWETPRAVTVRAQDDPVAEGRHSALLRHTISSIAPGYDTIGAISITVMIEDDDQQAVLLNTNSVNVTEGSAVTGSYSITLASQPSAAVTLLVQADSQSRVNGRASRELNFDASNWAISQEVVVSAVDDGLVEGPHTSPIKHLVISSDSGYHSISVPDMMVSIADNDSPSVSVTPGVIGVREGPLGASQSALYIVALTTRPAAPVVVTIDSGMEVRVNRSQLEFDTNTWRNPQSVTVVAQDDERIEATHTSVIQHRAESTDPDYAGIQIANVNVVISDDDATSDPDSDGVLTRQEDRNGDGDPTDDDSDGDNTPDYKDADDDGDELLTRDENALGASLDSDGDGTPDYLEHNLVDSDADTVADYLEPDTVDTDGDGLFNHLDDDDDGDGVPSATEGQKDTDMDSTPDYLDPDDDGDGLLTRVEGTTDSDNDGALNYLEHNQLDTDQDHVPDYLEPNAGDTDQDNVPDYLDTDDDGDGILTADEDTDKNGDPTDDDSDGDGVPDYLDAFNGRSQRPRSLFLPMVRR